MGCFGWGLVGWGGVWVEVAEIMLLASPLLKGPQT